MDAFATVEDIDARRDNQLTTAQKTRAASLLDDASAMLAAMLDSAGIAYTDAVDPLKTNLVGVTCSMVNRAINRSDADGINSQSNTAGPYSQTLTFSNPSGDLYVTSFEKRILGIGKSHFGSIRPHIRTQEGVEVDNW